MSVDFNLYILSLGIQPDQLGRILSAAPFAHMLAAIPIGFFAERLGFRKAFLVIYSVAGAMLLLQVATSSVFIITLAAFLSGLAISGDFVVRLPFLSANIGDEDRTFLFSLDAFLSGLTFAIGALLAGFLPNLFQAMSFDLSLAYRYTLYFSGALMVLAVVPVFMIRDQTHLTNKKISLKPYLWGIDRFTVKAAIVEFFIGATFGLIIPFMNVFFLYKFNTSREFYSSIEASAFLLTILITLGAPLLAARLGVIRSVIAGRFLVGSVILILAFTSSPWVGAGAYWFYKAIFSASQSLWFAFAMSHAAPKAKAALSSWIEITFQVALVMAAPLTGYLISSGSFNLAFYLSAGAAIITGILTWILIAPHQIQKPAE